MLSACESLSYREWIASMSNDQSYVSQEALLLECTALRKHLSDLQLLVAELIKANHLLRNRLAADSVSYSEDTPTARNGS